VKRPPDIFHYTEYQPFLRDWFETRKQNWPDYSYEQLCRKLGCSRTYAYYLFKGARSLPDEMVPAVARALGLGEDDAWYLGQLVDLAGQPSPDARRQRLIEVLGDERYRRGLTLEAEGSELMSHYLSWWLHPALLELVGAGDFREDPAWIARRFRFSVEEADVADALAFLLEGGFLARDRDGVLQVEENWLETAGEAFGDAIYQHHRDLLENARRALEDPPAQRHLSAATLRADEAGLEQLKSLINEFTRKAAAICEETPASGGEVFQFSVQLLALTQPVEDA